MRPRPSSRSHRGYWAFVGHRVSGLVLGLFLPVHFYVLGLALERQQELDAFLAFAQMPAVKFGEWGLVLFLSIHMFFGLRLLALELLPWAGTRMSWITWGSALSLGVGAVFILGVL